MKRLKIALFVCLIAVCAGQTPASPPTRSAQIAFAATAWPSHILIRYAPTDASLLNPERGFHDNIDLINDDDFRWMRQKGFTLARTYIRLDVYHERPLPDAFLKQLQRGFDAVRRAGIKVIPRFSYNSVRIPANIESGRYEMTLNLPDPAPALANRAEHSIQLANRDTWEQATGFNKPLHMITIK
ncbi:MAG: hypothetical protein KatS3mg053_2013 [Candidatus Roseilinea sp.]|nr:MAG: hypothetical protein KatS3mg053_2013 [Candidatus Roseilinea sp.]